MTLFRTFSLFLVATVVLGCGDDAMSSSSGGSGGSSGAGGSAGIGGMPPASAVRPDDYIRNLGFSRLLIEVDTVPGLSPRAGVTADVTDLLDDVLDKPNGIMFVTDDTDLPSADTYGNGDGVWTFLELQQLAGEQANMPLNNGEIAIHTMWLDGEYENPNVLGVAWGQRFLAMFAERIAQTCNLPAAGAVLCPLAEATVWTHEIGHVIGLVDNGIPMVNDHRDPDHGKHDVSDESVMYWAYDGVGVMDVLQARILGNNEDVIPWGAECLNDLAAVPRN
jgi:hypothetical protein